MRDKLLEEPEINEVAIKVAHENLELALTKKEKRRLSRIESGKFMYSLETKIFITNYSLCQISCDFIFSCTKGKTTAAESFEVLYGSFLRSESLAADFEETIQELKDWPYEGVPKARGKGPNENKLYMFQYSRSKTYNWFLDTLEKVPTKDDKQKKRKRKWIKLLNKRLTSIETVWANLE